MACRNEVFFSNRAAAYTSLKDYHKAILDARRVIAIKPKWAKGHSRLGAAHFALQDFSEVSHCDITELLTERLVFTKYLFTAW